MDDEFDIIEDAGGGDGGPVCPECLRPWDGVGYYCDHCGGNEAMNPLASYMPFVRIRFNAGMVGKVWRRFVGGQAVSIWRRVFDLMIVLVYFPFLVIGLPFVVYSKWRKGKIRDLRRVLICVFIVVMIVVCFFMVVYLGDGFGW